MKTQSDKGRRRIYKIQRRARDRGRRRGMGTEGNYSAVICIEATEAAASVKISKKKRKKEKKKEKEKKAAVEMCIM